MTHHRDQRSAASGLRVTRLTRDSLVQDSDAPLPHLAIRFADIREVRLSVEMAGPASQVVCRVEDEDGQEIVFSSMRWVGPRAYEPVAETFRALLVDLHEQLEPYRDDIRFLEGSRLGFMYAMFSGGLALAVLSLTGFAYLFLWRELAVGLLLLPGALAGGWIMRVFWPRPPAPYDPGRYARTAPAPAPDAPAND